MTKLLALRQVLNPQSRKLCISRKIKPLIENKCLYYYVCSCLFIVIHSSPSYALACRSCSKRTKRAGNQKQSDNLIICPSLLVQCAFDFLSVKTTIHISQGRTRIFFEAAEIEKNCSLGRIEAPILISQHYYGRFTW